MIDGNAAAARLRQAVAAAAATLRADRGIVPGLAAILVGDDPASQVYVRTKRRACEAAGLASFEHRLPGDASQASVVELVRRLCVSETVDGILVQLPLPPSIDPHPVIAAMDPQRDVDGFHPVNVGRLWGGEAGLVPCTPQGILMLLRQAHDDLGGAEAVVVGRSAIVGRPVAALLLAADCTVTIAHSQTRDLAALCRRADVLIAAAGRPMLIKGGWIKPGATVIDVGITRIPGPDGGTRLVGDVDQAAASAVAGAMTPVPGGVGPMTVACLLRNTVLAACRRRGLPDPVGL